MTARIVIFVAAQLAVSGYAARRGGWPERLVAVAMVVAMAASLLMPFEYCRTFRNVHWGNLEIDVLLLVMLVAVALCANRFWPLWLAALHLVTIGVHGVRAYDPAILPIVYSRLSGQIAYPMLLVLLIGTYRHRQRVRRFGHYADWSLPQRRRARDRDH